ncbi:MAG: alpha-ketoacid dehydrogenase subunit beta [Deltaproteobacteria bacterium]|nr:alpha-ketoacid dehydrogenase subunit beta [Deltaproteobacteria bacterium]
MRVRSTYREALRVALREALRDDPRVLLLGEDVAFYGGAFAVSHGLHEEFGTERVRDTPLSESAFLGAGIGAALGGLHPIVEVMTVNFSLLALDQIVNSAATLRHMSGGQMSVPMVVRMATGGGRQLAAQHSHSLEGWYAHVPGIKVLAPGTVDDARWMLPAALREPDPVFLFENARLYPMEGTYDDAGSPAEIGRAAVRRPGRDVTLIAFGGGLPKTLEAAETLTAHSVDAEVVDLRTLRPLDAETILGSVRRTRRAVIVDEAWRTGSFAAEVAARIAEEGFYDLEAPILRICGAEVPMPYAKHLEDAALPQPHSIVQAVLRTMGRA